MTFDLKFAPLPLAVALALLAVPPAYPQDAHERHESPPAVAATLEPVASTQEQFPPRSAEIPPPADAGPVVEEAGAQTVGGASVEQAAPHADREREIAVETPPAPVEPSGLTGEPAALETAPVESAAPASAPTAPAAQEQFTPQSAEAAPVAAPDAVAKESESDLPSAPSPIRTALREAVERMAAAPVARSAPGQTPAVAFRRERAAIAAFYEARHFEPLWIEGETFSPAARAAIARIERAREDGLDLGQYLPPTLDASSVEAMARADLALSQAVVGYARQASGVRVEPRSIGLITAKPEVASPEDVLAKVAASADAGETLAEYNPPHQAYRDLREKLFELRRERPAVAGQRIAPGPVLKVGMKDPRVPLVRARFGINAAADHPEAELVYDTRVASAVADFQRAHGLPASGTLTARTIALLSGGDPSRLEREILASMEKWRWAPRDMGETRIEVNIPDFRARLVRDGKSVHSMRVIVGKPETPTPVFSDRMTFMVVNPSWHVPQSIIRKQLAQDPGYYARNGYEVVRRGNNIFVRQPPGERNALGFVKFMFPNEHSVYMHDTPSRNLFNASRRAFSHGCVRVDQPFRFAEALMQETGWSEQRLRTLIGKGERTIRFSEGVPVHMMYFTAFVDDDGKLQLRDDLYGHSRKLQAALGL